MQCRARCIGEAPGYHACMSPRTLATFVKAQAQAVGFEACGIAPAGPTPFSDYLKQWLEAGRSGSMEYLHQHLPMRRDPRELVPDARSIIVVAALYHQPESEAGEQPVGEDPAGPRGKIARYAWGEDYHRVLKDRLHCVADALRAATRAPGETKVCVDTAPLVERAWAAAAGVGWIGKNTLVLHPRLGSYTYLGVIVTTFELEPDEPMADHCGTCRACLDACPTAALTAPYEMDASRCLSYLTIEHRAEIPGEFHEALGSWIFGCDICQEVCPHNRKALVIRDPCFALRPPAPGLPLADVLDWDLESYRAAVRGRALKRAKLEMWQRNARIALRNSGG